MHRFTITLPDDLHTWLTTRAQAEGRSKAKQVEHILKLFQATIGDHSAGLLHPAGYSLADERWLALRGDKTVKKGEGK